MLRWTKAENPLRSPTLFQRRPRRNADGEMRREGEKNVSGWSRWSRRKEQQRTLPNESRSHRLWNDGTPDSPSVRKTRINCTTECLARLEHVHPNSQQDRIKTLQERQIGWIALFQSSTNY